ncbi:hypothetical protein [Gimesia aquarii]|nr:hypothetical protein [Gimesia aquarii]
MKFSSVTSKKERIFYTEKLTNSNLPSHLLCHKLHSDFLTFDIRVCRDCFWQILYGLSPEEQSEKTMLVAISSIAAVFEKRSNVDKHVFDYPVAQFSESVEFSDDFMEIYLKEYPEDLAKFMSELALQISTHCIWCTRACVFLVVCWFSDNFVLPDWYEDWKDRLDNAAPDDAKRLVKWRPFVDLYKSYRG